MPTTAAPGIPAAPPPSAPLAHTGLAATLVLAIGLTLIVLGWAALRSARARHRSQEVTGP